VNKIYSREQRVADLERRLKFYRKRCNDLICEALSKDLQACRARRYLFHILDGDDREMAINEARAWLKRFYKDDETYQLISVLVNRELPKALAELEDEKEMAGWPKDLPL